MKQQKSEESRKKQKQLILDKAGELADLVVNSEDYIRYQEDLRALKSSDQMYQRLKDYRLRSMVLQITDDSENSYTKLQELYSEYQDILSDPLVTRFLMTEQSICKIMRRIQKKLFDEIDLDISYFE